jgi:hypothetical protein
LHSGEWLEGLAPKRNHPRALLLQTNERIGLDAEPWVALQAASRLLHGELQLKTGRRLNKNSSTLVC